MNRALRSRSRALAIALTIGVLSVGAGPFASPAGASGAGQVVLYTGTGIRDPFHLVAATAKAKARGEIASALNPPPGCHFNPRCPMKADRCVSEVPLLEAVAAGHRAACHFRDRMG